MKRRTQIYLEKLQHKRLKHIAVNKDISLSELIRRILDEYLEKKDNNETNKSISS